MSLARNLSKFKPSSSGLVETADIADDAVSTDQIANNATINTSGAITTTGAFTSVGIDDNSDATAITIDSSERVGIGTTSPAQLLHVKANNPGGKIRLEMGQTGVANTDVTGEIQFYQNDASGAGVNADIKGICTNSAGAGALTFGTGTTSTTERMRIASDGDVTVSSGNLVIGTSGKGIDFSAETGDGPSVTSELLDSYEEGHIGTITMNSSGSNTIDSAYTSKYYIKVGRVVHCYFHIVLNGTLSAGSHALVGLPFTSSNSNPAHRGAGVANAQDASSSYGQDGNYVSITTSENVTSATLYNPVQYVANDRLNVYFSYVTAS